MPPSDKTPVNINRSEQRMKMKQYFRFVENLSYGALFSFCTLITALIGGIDYLIGPELSSAILYLLPIILASWYGDRKLGIFISKISTLAWIFADVASGRQYSHFWILFWNAGVRLGIFLIINHFVAAFHKKLTEEETAADTDSLTGTFNSRAFYEKTNLEIERSKRFNRPLSLAYIDLDNFKQVNDDEGHAIGDELLKVVVNTILNNSRKNDVVARIGGDEFAILFIESDYTSAASAMEKLHRALLLSMEGNSWPVTFSIGMITYVTSPPEAHEMLRRADELMYSVKKSGKNSIKHLSIE